MNFPIVFQLTALALVSLLQVSCATSKSFKIVSENGKVANVQARYKEFYFAPSGVAAAAKARQYFTTAARTEAAKQGKSISSISLFQADVKRNEMTGYYTFELEGRMQYGQEPFTGPSFSDNSQLMLLARTSQSNSEHLNAAIFGMANGLHESNARNARAMSELQTQQAIQSQNWEMQRLTQSINNNTNAIRSISSQPIITPSYSPGTLYLVR